MRLSLLFKFSVLCFLSSSGSTFLLNTHADRGELWNRGRWEPQPCMACEDIRFSLSIISTFFQSFLLPVYASHTHVTVFMFSNESREVVKEPSKGEETGLGTKQQMTVRPRTLLPHLCAHSASVSSGFPSRCMWSWRIESDNVLNIL